ncbi:MAG: acyloxyacyl hydrolase [Acidobacteriaceae bacterium]
MKRLLVTFAVFCAVLAAQTDNLPVGSKEAEPFLMGGHSVAGGTGNASTFAAGLRFGYVFSPAPGGALAYTIEFIPLYLINQRKTAYGVSFTPFNVKYNLTHLHRVVPYIELGGGVLFTNHDVPDSSGGVPIKTSQINFTPQAGIGFHFPIKPNSNKHLGLALKYVHISNAGLANRNPGINTIQVKLSVGHYCSRDSNTYNDQTSKCSWVHY